MTAKKKLMIVYTIFACAAALGLATWRTLLIYRFFDPYTEEYMLGAKPHLDMFGYVLAAVILAIVPLFFLMRRDSFGHIIPNKSQFSVVANALCAFACVAVNVFLVVYYGSSVFNRSTLSVYTVLLIITFVVQFPAAVHFIFSASSRNVSLTARKLLSFFPTLASLFYLIASYINPNYLYQDANRILCHVSIMAYLIFFLLETRNIVVEQQIGIQFAVALIALICSFTYVMPLLITTAFWESHITANTLFELIECGTIVYILAVLRTMLHTPITKIPKKPHKKKSESSSEDTPEMVKE